VGVPLAQSEKRLTITSAPSQQISETKSDAKEKQYMKNSLKKLGYMSALVLLIVGAAFVFAGCEGNDSSSSSNNAPSHSGHNH